jgi:hypothetical protein
VPLIYDYTDRSGYNGIRAGEDWCFKAAQPPPHDHPPGAYFAILMPETQNLAQRLRVPVSKIEYFFAFEDAGDLIPLRGGRGRYILYSPTDYTVVKARQQSAGERPI